MWTGVLRRPLLGLLAALAMGLVAGCDLLRGTEPPAASVGAEVWRPGPAAPLALTEVAAAAHDGRIWVAGGLTADGRATTAVQVLDPATGAWSDGPALPESIHHSALVSDDETLWLLGGYTSDALSVATATVRRLAGDAWVEDVPLPEPRAAGAAAWDGSRLVYAGGVSSDVSALVYGRTDAGWEPIGRLAEAREHLAATSDGTGRVWVVGGRRGDLGGNLATVDLVEASGVSRLDDLPTRRGGVTAFHWPSLGGCLVGGESPEGTNDEVECITADGVIGDLPRLAAPRHGLGAAVVDGVAYVLLGGPEPGLTVSGTVETFALP